MYYRQVGNHVFKSFDIKFSRVARVLVELHHLPPQNILKVTSGHEELNIFQKNFCTGFLWRFPPCKLYKLEFEKKSEKTGHPNI